MESVLAYKQTAELDVAKLLTKYIAQHYSDHEAAKHREACHEFGEEREALRLALREERATLEQLQHYYHRLDNVAAHFPISVRDTKFTFVWYDSMSTKKKCTQPNLALERSATIFNMAAAYASQAGNYRQMMTEDGTKQASLNFLWAAACFRQLRTAFVPILGDPITADLSLAVVSALEKLMEAEAQELWLSQAEAKAMKKSLPGLTQGTLSLWQEAQRFISAGNLGQILPAKVLHQVDMRICWLTANAQRHYISHPDWLDVTVDPGKAIARLRIAVEELGKARTIAKKHLDQSIQQQLALAAAEVDSQLQGLEKDNETIYLDVIPLAGQLDAIKPLVMIKPAELSLSGSFGDKDEQTDDLWESLVSVDEYAAVRSFKEQEQQISPQLVQELGGTMTEHTAKAHEQLRALGLPHALEGLNTPSGEIPQSMLKKISAMHAAGGVEGLEAAVRGIQVKVDNRAKILSSCDDIIKREAEEDAQYRAQYGPKWTAKPSDAKTVRLRKEWTATKKLWTQEAEKLEKIESQIRGARPELKMVSAPVDDIIKQIPSSLGAPNPSVAAEVVEVSTQLMQLIGQLEDLCEARAAIQEAWREAAASIDIRGALRGSDPTHREALVKAELQKYDAPAAAARESVAEQARILQLIGEANAEFLRLKPPQTEVARVVQEFFDRCSSALREASRLRNEIDNLISERESTAKHFARLEPECIRYVEKRAAKRETLLQSLGVAHPRVYRSPSARAGGGGRSRGGRGTQSRTRGRGSGSDDRRNHRGRGGDGGSSHHHGAAQRTRVRRSSVERSIHIQTGGDCTWWWRAGGTAGNDVYKPYSDEQSSLLEAAFLAYTNGDDSQQSASPGKVILSSEYVVDFATMRQLNTRDERKSRSVQRREKQVEDDEQIVLPEACPPGQEPEPEPEPEAEPVMSPAVDLPATLPLPPAPAESNASSAAITMGFDAALVERVQVDQRAACGSEYEDLHELLPALLAREEQDRADAVPGPPPASESPRPAVTPAPSGVSAIDTAVSSPVEDQPAGVWEWKADRGWKPYSSAQNLEIETAWKTSGGNSSSGPQQRHPLQGRIVLEGGTHAIDFEKMRQVKVGDEKRARAVRRREEPVPQIFAHPNAENVLSPSRPMIPPVTDQADGPQANGGESLAVWQWKTDRGWKPYSQEQSAQIEQAFAESAGNGEHVLEGGAYAIDFSHMRQVNTADRRRSRAVRRLEKQA